MEQPLRVALLPFAPQFMSPTTTTLNAAVIVERVRGVDDVLSSCRDGVLRGWDQVFALDPSATVYQSRAWCSTWYECYDDAFNPVVLAVSIGGDLVGLVPLCIERSNRHVHFAGRTFSDYRDVLAIPAHRATILTALLRYYRQSRAPNVLRIGPMTPDSASASLLASLLVGNGIRGIRRVHSGWRYLSELATPETDPLKSKTLKYNYNWYKRNGGSIAVEVVTDRQQWQSLRQTFFDQHSLRQLSAGRTISFDDPRKAMLFDRMFDDAAAHFCVLLANGRVIATHFGFRTGSLLHWGAPAFDIREAARSPSLLLIGLIMTDLKHWNLSGLDLTIGEGFLKERFSNVRVDLPSYDVYPSSIAFGIESLRTRLAAAIRTRPRLSALANRTAAVVSRAKGTVTRHGLLGSVTLAVRLVRNALWEFNTGLVLTVTPDTLVPESVGSSEVGVRHSVNAYEDLLRWSESDVMTQYMINATAESIIPNAKQGRHLHTLVVDGQLACIGLSYLPAEPATLTETGNLPFTFELESASLYSFYTVPEFRGRGLYQVLLRRILAWHFAAGVKLAYISVLENNLASLRAIEKVGFRRFQRNTVQRTGPLRRVRRVGFPGEVSVPNGVAPERTP